MLGRALLHRFLLRRLGPVGLAITAYDVWRRIPREQRQRLLAEGRRHAPSVAARGRDVLRRGREAHRKRDAVRR